MSETNSAPAHLVLVGLSLLIQDDELIEEIRAEMQTRGFDLSPTEIREQYLAMMIGAREFEHAG